jgi:hypothetical protein
MDMDWETIANEFANDGGLLDLYVLNADVPDWQRLIDALRESVHGLSYEVDGETIELPGQVTDIFAQWEIERSPTLRVLVDGIEFRCHFFNPNEIEFDLAPEEVAERDRLDSLFNFMRWLGNLTRKTVVLTPENLKTAPIFAFDPGTREIVNLPTRL